MPRGGNRVGRIGFGSDGSGQFDFLEEIRSDRVGSGQFDFKKKTSRIGFGFKRIG
jgi:hypothetical protein